MKAIISSTYDNNYFYFLPIVTYCWNKLWVDVICFIPTGNSTVEKNNSLLQGVYPDGNKKMYLITETIKNNNGNISINCFNAPEHKEATYSQVSRLYAACLDLPEDEVLITSDVDMAVFGDYLKQFDGNIQLFGADLLEGEKMYPMCYCSMTVKQWRNVMRIEGRSYQQCLDDKLGKIEADHFRGNYWCADQENLFNAITTSIIPITKHKRAKLPERFATRRLDREDSYLMERDVLDIVDFHLPRPGYEHFEKIITILEKIYPNDGFDWLRDYNEAYKKLL